MTSWNPGAERVFGYATAEMLGQAACRLFTCEDRQAGVLARESAPRACRGAPARRALVVCKEGRRFWAQWLTEPVRDEAVQRLGGVRVLRDETERKVPKRVNYCPDLPRQEYARHSATDREATLFTRPRMNL